jgi:hypothetical protein
MEISSAKWVSELVRLLSKFLYHFSFSSSFMYVYIYMDNSLHFFLGIYIYIV